MCHDQINYMVQYKCGTVIHPIVFFFQSGDTNHYENYDNGLMTIPPK